MASIRQRDGKYQVRIIRKGHRALSRTFNNRTDAIKWARQTEVEIERGAIQTHTRSITLADAITRYREERTPNKKSARSERYLLDAWARSQLAEIPLNCIRPTQIAEWRDARSTSGAAAQTIRNGLTVLSAVYEQAIREWGFDHLSNPVRRIRRPPAPRGRCRRVSQEEVQRIIDNTKSPSLAPIVTLALTTGMRLSEITLMRWGNLDFQQKTLLLPDTKNGDARTIPLSTTATNTLLTLRRTKTTSTSERVFDIAPHAVTVSFRRAVRRARAAYIAEQTVRGTPDAGLLCNLRFHDLRHEAVTRLFEKGLNTIEVGTISGHKTIQTLNRYTHLRAADLVDKLG
jgi:integrase